MAVVSLDLQEVLEEAFEQAGLEMRSGYDLKTARRSFNLLTIEWANRGINLWTLDDSTKSITAGTDTYTLDTDTIDIIEHMLKDSENREFTLRRISVSTYAKLSDKTLTGRPSLIFVQRLAASTQIRLWPVPDRDWTLVYWRLRGIDGLSSGSGDGATPDVPPRFIPALCAGLAFHIAIKKPKLAARVEPLREEYERQWDLAAGEDRDRSSIRLVPARP